MINSTNYRALRRAGRAALRSVVTAGSLVSSLCSPRLRAGRADSSSLSSSSGSSVASGSAEVEVSSLACAGSSSSSSGVSFSFSRASSLETKVTLTAHLYAGTEEVTEGLSYRWYDLSNPDNILYTGNPYIINKIDFNDNLNYA